MLNMDHARLINLRCPTCSSTEFSGASQGGDDTQVLTCAVCELEITRRDLMEENRENLHEHAKEIGKEVVDDLARELKRKLEAAFPGSRNIRIK